MKPGLLKDMDPGAPAGSRILGLDVGKTTIGLATGDIKTGIIMPLQTIKRTKFTQDAQTIFDLARDYGIDGFIIGLPLNMDGSAGRRAQSVTDFAALFYERRPARTWVALHDERLSTNEAEHIIEDTLNLNQKKAKKRGITDQLAAVHILESALSVIKSVCNSSADV